MPGGRRTLSLAGAAGGTPALGGAQASGGRVVNVAINGGTFTNQQSISGLAHTVSEATMHNVRLQDGLLPHM